MADVYYVTKRPYKMNTSLIMFLPSLWGFEKGDLVKFRAWKVGDTREYIYTARVARTSSKPCITLGKSWGITEDDMVTIAVWRIPEGSHDGGERAQG